MFEFRDIDNTVLIDDDDVRDFNLCDHFIKVSFGGNDNTSLEYSTDERAYTDYALLKSYFKEKESSMTSLMEGMRHG